MVPVMKAMEEGLCQHIRELHLRRVGMDTKAVVLLADAASLHYIPLLEVLDLRKNPAISDIALSALICSLGSGNCSSLRVLELCHPILDDEVNHDIFFGRVPPEVKSPGDAILSERTAQELLRRWRDGHWMRLTHLSLHIGWCRDSYFLHDLVMAAKSIEAMGPSSFLTHLTLTCPTPPSTIEDLVRALGMVTNKKGLTMVWPRLEHFHFVALMGEEKDEEVSDEGDKAMMEDEEEEGGSDDEHS